MPFGLSRPIAAVAAAAVLLMGALPAAAVTNFNATLSGANETVPTGSTGVGTGLFTLSDDRNSLEVAVTFNGLTAPAVAGHLHCCAAPGSNAAVAIPFTFASATSGSINQTFDLTSAAIYTPGFVTASGGTAALAQSAFLAGLDGGLVYANVHTSTFPGGEIRGQLGAVPEPASWALMVSGFGLVGASIRRRRVITA
ncbi:CHRD domain-containing protein [Sphingosinicellaceae bacterium]|nr:CHRD domain-containing protein [Sphingosinicellaceae bacterium]